MSEIPSKQHGDVPGPRPGSPLFQLGLFGGVGPGRGFAGGGGSGSRSPLLLLPATPLFVRTVVAAHESVVYSFIFLSAEERQIGEHGFRINMASSVKM